MHGVQKRNQGLKVGFDAQEDGFNRDDVLAELKSLREQNKKLAGHTNLKQRIHHVSKLKEEVRGRNGGWFGLMGADLFLQHLIVRVVLAWQNATLKTQLWKLKKRFGADATL